MNTAVDGIARDQPPLVETELQRQHDGGCSSRVSEAATEAPQADPCKNEERPEGKERHLQRQVRERPGEAEERKPCPAWSKHEA
jgi:hypothetical protein